jgi:sporulation protein YlmC with PRC-barrel domain
MSKSDSTTNSELEKLSDTFLTLADPTQDVRNFKVVDRHDEEIGHVSDLFIDQAERKIQMLEIRAGGFLGLGERHFLLPISAITSVANGEVHVNQTRERIVGAPKYDPALVVAPTPAFWGQYYGYYGMLPYWGPGYTYPSYPVSQKYTDTNEPSGGQREPNHR